MALVGFPNSGGMKKGTKKKKNVYLLQAVEGAMFKVNRNCHRIAVSMNFNLRSLKDSLEHEPGQKDSEASPRWESTRPKLRA